MREYRALWRECRALSTCKKKKPALSKEIFDSAVELGCSALDYGERRPPNEPTVHSRFVCVCVCVYVRVCVRACVCVHIYRHVYVCIVRYGVIVNDVRSLNPLFVAYVCVCVCVRARACVCAYCQARNDCE